MTRRTLALQCGLVALAAIASLPAQDAAAPSATCTLQLRVLDQEGKPIAGAGAVVGTLHTVTTDDALQRPTSTSDRDGNLSVVTPASQKRSMPAAVLVTARGRRSVIVEARAEVGQVSLGSVFLFPSATLRGRVRDGDGKPVVGARIEASEPVIGNPRSDGHNCHLRTATTSDAQGIFALAGASTGCSVVTCSKPGYHGALLFPVFVDTAATLVLERSGFVSGKVVGAPAGARVHLVGGDAGVSGAPPEADADGAFQLPITSRGDVHVVVTDDIGQVIGKSPTLSGPVTDLEVIATTVPLRVVVMSDHRPVPLFTVTPWWGAPGPGWNVQFPESFLGGIRGRDGAAELQLSRLTRPTFLRVRAADCLPASVPMIASGAEIVCNLERGAEVSGRITDHTGAPLAGARVFLQGLPPDARTTGSFVLPTGAATTDGAGAFRIGGVSQGRFAVQVDHRDFAVPDGVAIEVAQGAAVTLAPMSLQPLAAVVGRLRGAVAAGAQVGVASESVRVFHSGDSFTYRARRRSTAVTPGADGTFALRGLPPVAQPLVLILPPSQPSAPSVELPLGDFTPAAGEQIVDTGGARVAVVTGTVTCNRPEALRGLRVVAVAADGSPIDVVAGCADVGSDGRYALRLAAGKYWCWLYDLTTHLQLDKEQPLVADTDKAAIVNFAAELWPVTFELQPKLATPAALHGSLRLQDQRKRMRSLGVGMCADWPSPSLQTPERRQVVALPTGDFGVLVECFGDGPRKLFGAEGFNVAQEARSVQVELAAVAATDAGK